MFDGSQSWIDVVKSSKYGLLRVCWSWVPRVVEKPISRNDCCYTIWICFNPLPRPSIIVTEPGRMDSNAWKNAAYDFTKGFPSWATWSNGFLKEASWSWTTWWTKEGATSASWISSPNIRIIETSRSCICVKTCFRRGNMPRAFPETRITSWPSKTLAMG